MSELFRSYILGERDNYIDPLTVPPHSVWRHVKTGGMYVVLGLARCSTNGPREGVEYSVVYFSLTHQHLCYREASEFLDGRFVRVEKE